MTSSTVDIDEIRIALEIAGRVINGSLTVDDLKQEVTDIMDTEEIEEDRREVLETLIRSFRLFARNVRIGQGTPD